MVAGTSPCVVVVMLVSWLPTVMSTIVLVADMTDGPLTNLNMQMTERDKTVMLASSAGRAVQDRNNHDSTT